MPGVADEWPSNAQSIYRSVERHCFKPLKPGEYPREGTSIFFRSPRSFADGSRGNWRSDAQLERRAGHLTRVCGRLSATRVAIAGRRRRRPAASKLPFSSTDLLR